ncbi:sensor histidine kinase [Brooklawnia cerclae]|uniref:histidine kinase n=1 Tax=Brooklawnia cerclae TaxID=349934 RepID=A0ABX0SHH5_9ACTN|nr:histidine kinase [Brooklawnia cerclae]NIH57804.1 signal transduction histidine kinase [Brooklawnia cerclae]
MPAIHPSPTVRRIASVVWLVVGALLGAAACLVSGVAAISAEDVYMVSGDPQGELTDVGVLAMLAVLASLPALLMRRREPWIAVAGGALLTSVLRLDSLLLLLGAGAVVVHRDRAEAQVASVIAGLITIWAGVRDGFRPWLQTAWAVYIDPDPLEYGEADQMLQLGISVGIAVLTGAVVLGAAWFVRFRGDLSATREARAAAEHRGDRLEETVSRQDERERLAREVHDALAHRLSLISLHSGALEDAAASSDPAVSQAAHVLRDNAHRSLEDLRDLVSALREPTEGTHPAVPEAPDHEPSIGFGALPDLIDSARAAGVPVDVTVLVQDAGSASDLLDRGVYRIAQEALTNAVKHAPGCPVRFDLRASPATGVHLVVANLLNGVDSGLPGAMAGIIGMQERASRLGGVVRAAPDGRGGFVVDARIPWSSRSTPRR